MEAKKRLAFFDNIKGFLILLVVFGHSLYYFADLPLISDIVSIIYVFHMPAFVFVSGYFSRSEHSKNKDSLLKLLSAYIIFNTLLMLYSFSANNTSFSLTSPYYSCWYLIALIIWRFVSRYIPINKKTLLISTAAALAVGLFGDVGNVFAASRTVAFFPFFIMGMMSNNKRTEKFIEKRKFKHYICGIIFVLMSVVFSFFIIHSYGVTQDDLQMSSYTGTVDILKRILIFFISAIFITGLFLCVPNKKLFFLTKTGRASLSIYLLHRIPTLLCNNLLGNLSRSEYIILAGIIETIVITAICNLNIIFTAINKVTEAFVAVVRGKNVGKYTNMIKITSIMLASFIVIIPIINISVPQNTVNNKAEEAETTQEDAAPDIMYNQISDEQMSRISNSTKILFAGDLILLEDQVKRGYKDGKYNFDDVFEYAKKYISAADISIGVFEGPMAGEAAGYSTSNYADGKTLALNYPDEFADAVKEAGFDLVTTANNHFLDKDVDGAIRTLDVLDKIKLDHTGTYRNCEEKNRLKIIEKNGIKIAVLSYTYGTNNYTEDDLLSEEYSYLTSLTADPGGKNFIEAKKRVENDFERAGKLNPDLIVVLPHMGEQFLDEPDDYQKTWNDIFISLGADIILNDHTHSVQPVEVSYDNGKVHIIVNCPGNFANIYRENFGDASAMVEIYIDNETKKPNCASVIPMWTESLPDGNYRAVPIYELINNEAVRTQISTYDLERIDEVQRHITKIMLGYEMSLDLVKERYYLTADGLYLPRCEQLRINEELKNTVLYEKIVSAQSVCYVGDSVTEGTKNGGYGWYRPIEKLNAHTYECAKGGATTKKILSVPDSKYSLYVVAIGTNDVRYRDENICAMTKEEYISQLQKFTNRILKDNPKAEFCFIAPWTALENDTVCAVGISERDRLLSEYTAALKEWCGKNGYIFSDPNEYITEYLSANIQSDYLIDYIHPNCTAGIALYAESVLKYSQQ